MLSWLNWRPLQRWVSRSYGSEPLQISDKSDKAGLLASVSSSQLNPDSEFSSREMSSFPRFPLTSCQRPQRRNAVCSLLHVLIPLRSLLSQDAMHSFGVVLILSQFHIV